MSNHNTNHNSTETLITRNKNYGSLSDDDRKNTEKDVYFDAVTNAGADANGNGNGNGNGGDADTDFNNEQLQSLYTDELALKKEATKKVRLLPDAVMDWLYPPELPPELQLFRRDNIAIPLCYLLVGTVQGLSDPIMAVYPLDLGATEAQQATVAILGSLPCTLKLIFGFLSDNFPILGYRRKSYMIVGWLLTSLSYGVLLVTTDVSLTKGEDGILIPPKEAPSIALFSAMTFLFSTGYWIADVMGDSILAEKSIKYETSSMKGVAQSSCYSYRFLGYMIAGPVATGLYKMYHGPIMIMVLISVLPLFMIPLLFCLNEKRNLTIPSTLSQCKEIWTTVCSRAVWQPMGFIYIYNALQIGNGAWSQYLRTILHFTSTQINMISIVSSVLLYVGVVSYKTFMLSWSWRYLYLNTTLINLFFSVMQLSLIANITFGLSPFFFALGDDALSTFIDGIQFLPQTIMMTNLCPVGSEGASFALFTTVKNTGLVINAALSSYLLGIGWDVSKEALKHNDLSGMMSLTIFTTLLQFSGIFFLWMLPRNRDELLALHHGVVGDSTSSSPSSSSSSTSKVLSSSSSSSSRIGGFIFLATTILSVLYSTVVAILNIVTPGWNGES